MWNSLEIHVYIYKYKYCKLYLWPRSLVWYLLTLFWLQYPLVYWVFHQMLFHQCPCELCYHLLQEESQLKHTWCNELTIEYIHVRAEWFVFIDQNLYVRILVLQFGHLFCHKPPMTVPLLWRHVGYHAFVCNLVPALESVCVVYLMWITLTLFFKWILPLDRNSIVLLYA